MKKYWTSTTPPSLVLRCAEYVFRIILDLLERRELLTRCLIGGVGGSKNSRKLPVKGGEQSMTMTVFVTVLFLLVSLQQSAVLLKLISMLEGQHK